MISIDRSSNRLRTTLFLIGVVAAGIIVRKVAGPLPGAFRKVAGDVLWGTLFFLLTHLAFPRISIWKTAVIAFMVASATEIAKLIHTPVLDSVRATPIGGFLLGHTFLPFNFFWYAIGAAAGAAAFGRR